MLGRFDTTIIKPAWRAIKSEENLASAAVELFAYRYIHNGVCNIEDDLASAQFFMRAWAKFNDSLIYKVRSIWRLPRIIARASSGHHWAVVAMIGPEKSSSSPLMLLSQWWQMDDRAPAMYA